MDSQRQSDQEAPDTRAAASSVEPCVILPGAPSNCQRRATTPMIAVDTTYVVEMGVDDVGHRYRTEADGLGREAGRIQV